MGDIVRAPDRPSDLLRYCLTGALVCGLVGAVVGLVIGLRVYVPTAWAAVFEVGLPAAVLGAVGGGAVAAVVLVGRRARRRSPTAAG